MSDSRVLKGRTLAFAGDPFAVGPDAATRYEADGAVWIEDGLIRAVGPVAEVTAQAGDVPADDHSDHLLTAGFVDCHA
ncbi:MAG: guanine deaminase, partial [Rhodospirillaceae bacterium]